MRHPEERRGALCVNSFRKQTTSFECGRDPTFLNVLASCIVSCVVAQYASEECSSFLILAQPLKRAAVVRQTVSLNRAA
jgi:hypothetical protein